VGLGLRGGGAVDEQQAAGVGILLQISMLVLSFVLGHLLRRRKFYYLPEASASLLIGMCPPRHPSFRPPFSDSEVRSSKCRSLITWEFTIVMDAIVFLL
jgi:hypothetical protein